uniref:Glyco_hydro_20b domain-containing protein n=1 Tax=Heterorhabditis bacteriophora TaxID=37862 RepID=A0A1I7X993_HETBA
MTTVAEHSIGRVWQEEGERNEDAIRFLNGTDPTLQIPIRTIYTTRLSQDLSERPQPDAASESVIRIQNRSLRSELQSKVHFLNSLHSMQFVTSSPGRHENGIVQQQFDYSDQSEKEFSSITTDPTGQNVVVASFDRLPGYLAGLINCLSNLGTLHIPTLQIVDVISR